MWYGNDIEKRKIMLDRKDSQSMPTQQDISQYIHNPLWDLFYQYMIDQYHSTPKYEFSKCSWEYGWNIKMKKVKKRYVRFILERIILLLWLLLERKRKKVLNKYYQHYTITYKIFMQIHKREMDKNG